MMDLEIDDSKTEIERGVISMQKMYNAAGQLVKTSRNDPWATTDIYFNPENGFRIKYDDYGSGRHLIKYSTEVKDQPVEEEHGYMGHTTIKKFGSDGELTEEQDIEHGEGLRSLQVFNDNMPDINEKIEKKLYWIKFFDKAKSYLLLDWRKEDERIQDQVAKIKRDLKIAA